MIIEECFFLGYTSKVHGKSGEVIIKLDVDDSTEYQDLESVFIRLSKNDKQLIPFFIENTHLLNNGNLRVKFEDIHQIDEAKKILYKELYLPLSVLPPLTGNKFYFHEVKGFEIVDLQLGKLGVIKQVLDFPNQAVFEVINDNKQEILIPITDEIVENVDRVAKKITVNTPEGLIDIYLE